MIDAGELKNRITLLKPNINTDAIGGESIDFNSPEINRTVWAKVYTQPASYNPDVLIDERKIKHIVVIRTPSTPITPVYRVVFANGRYAQVIATRDPDNTGEFMELQCEESIL